MAVKHLTKENFAQELQVPGKHAVVDFYADWCGPCQGMKPILEDLSEECPEVAFYKVNVDEQQALAVQFGISSIPTFCFFDGGALVQNHLYMMTVEGRGVRATAATTKLLVRGSYTVS